MLKRFRWMYRTLTNPDQPHVTEAQLRNAIQILEQALPLAGQLIQIMPPYHPTPSATLPGHTPA